MGGGGQSSYNSLYHSIVLDSKIEVDITQTTNLLGIVNVKKFYALELLKDKYEYIIILDSECEITKAINVYELCEKFYSDKILYGNEVFPNYTFFNANIIYKTCKKYFVGHKDLHKLNDKLYLWFNQLCIFKCEYLDDFFRITNITKQYEMLTFWDFEYYIFMYYLILYKDFKIVDMEVIASGGALECDSFYPKNGSRKYLSEPFMVCHLALYPYLNKENLFVIHHKDRITNARRYMSLEELQESTTYKLGTLYMKRKKSYFKYLRLAYKILKLYGEKDVNCNTLGCIVDYEIHQQIEAVKNGDIYQNGLFIENLCGRYANKKRWYAKNKILSSLYIAYKLIRAKKRIK